MISSGKTAIVTGAGQGIGKAIARMLAEEGAAVLVNDLVAERAKAVASELRDDNLSAVAFAADVSDEAEVQAMIDRALADLGAAPRVEMELGTPEAMKRLVEVGLGFAVLPERLVRDELRRGRLALLPVRGLRVTRALGFAAAPSRPLTPAAQAFMRMAWNRFRPSKRAPASQPARRSSGSA